MQLTQYVPAKNQYMHIKVVTYYIIKQKNKKKKSKE